MSEQLPQALSKNWFGQPRGLTILFLTEMWEKFSFYGMRTLLVYYMTKELLMAQERASYIYGLYTAFVYLTPIAGGMIADRWLGRRKSVILGGSIMALGHFMMAFESLFFPALGVIALGNGLFLPSLPSQINGLYGSEDPRRGSAYNVYYVGINLGAFLAPLVCGTLGEIYGWHWGFGAAGIGMVAGLMIYIAGGRYLPPDPITEKPREAVAAPADMRARLMFLMAVAAIVVVFRGAYEQIGNTVALWADAGVNRSVTDSLAIPMTWFQSLNPMMVFLLTPLFVAHWTRKAKEGREPLPLAKMATGAGIVAASYLMLAAVSSAFGEGSTVSWLWLAAFFVLMTAGELYILPVGLSLFGRLAPAKYGATAIAVWFSAAFAGNLLAGYLGGFWSQLSHAAFFAMIATVAASAMVLLFLYGRYYQTRYVAIEAEEKA